MVDAQQDQEQSDVSDGHRVHGRRRSWLYLLLGLVLAGALASVLISATSSNRSTGNGLISTGPSQFPGLNPSTVNLLSLSRYPGQAKPAPDFHLTDQNGRPVSLSQFRGKSVVLSFNDDQCTDVCTLLAEDVVRADNYLGATGASRVVFLSVNVNPFYPQPEYARQWSDNNDLGNISNWFFGTGPVATLRSIWKQYGVYVGTDSATRSVTHSALIEFIGPSGTIEATADFGQTAVDVAPYSHGMAQAAIDLLPASERTPVAGPQAPNPTGTGPGLGQKAPAFSLAAVTGGAGPVTLAGLAGQPVVLNFWASTCVDCRAELAGFAKVAAAEPKIRFIGIDVGDPSSTAAESMARSAGIEYPILADTDGRVASSYKVSGLPTTVYVDPTGHIAVIHPGAMTAEQLTYTLGQFFPNYTPQSS